MTSSQKNSLTENMNTDKNRWKVLVSLSQDIFISNLIGSHALIKLYDCVRKRDMLCPIAFKPELRGSQFYFNKLVVLSGIKSSYSVEMCSGCHILELWKLKIRATVWNFRIIKFSALVWYKIQQKHRFWYGIVAKLYLLSGTVVLINHLQYGFFRHII